MADQRFYFVSQYDWGAKRGFYVDVEGTELAKLPLILGVADGRDWRFASVVPPFELGRRYTVRAVLTPEGSQMFLDGRLACEIRGGFAPAGGRFEVGVQPHWASDLGDYVMVQESVRATVERNGRQVAQISDTMGLSPARPLPLYLFQPDESRAYELEVKPGDTLTVEFEFRPETSDLNKFAPFVDRYGQAVHGDWPGKVRSDEELQADIAREAAILATMPPSPDYDRYGGYKAAGWREQPTGFFYVTRRDGKWWLITPEGNPCFYLGVCSIPGQTWETTPVTGREFLFEWLPPEDGSFAPCWGVNLWGIQDGTKYFCHYAANLIRKYGAADWRRRAEEQCLRRLRAWGFHGGGKWGAPGRVVEVAVIGRWATPSLAGHPDIFAPAVAEAFRRDIERQVLPRRDDPWLLGWSLGNEYDEIIKRQEVRAILKMGPDVPAKRALVDHALDVIYAGDLARLSQAWKISPQNRDQLYAASPDPPTEDIEALRQFYQDRYYDFIYTTVKDLDPNHLYLGNWIVPGWWEGEADWHIIARHCDVIGYDHYAIDHDSDLTRRLKRETNKPVLLGEYSYPPFYGGTRGVGRYHVYGRDDAHSGELYYRRIRQAAEDPYCVGALWFLYRDQPITGRGPGRGPKLVHGEHFCFGLVDATDRPRWDMVRRMREANLKAAQWRLGVADE